MRRPFSPSRRTVTAISSQGLSLVSRAAVRLGPCKLTHHALRNYCGMRLCLQEMLQPAVDDVSRLALTWTPEGFVCFITHSVDGDGD